MMASTKRKRLFALAALIFVLLLGLASYDIGRRTTFPGSKSQLKERLKKNYLDDTPTDSTTDRESDSTGVTPAN